MKNESGNYNRQKSQKSKNEDEYAKKTESYENVIDHKNLENED